MRKVSSKSKIQAVENIVCRICLSKQNTTKGMKSIKAVWNNDLKYSDLIKSLCGKECNVQNIPENICKKCIKNLVNSYKFKLKCCEAELKWMNAQITLQNDIKIDVFESNKSSPVENNQSDNYRDYNTEITSLERIDTLDTLSNNDFTLTQILVESKTDDFTSNNEIENNCLLRDNDGNENSVDIISKMDEPIVDFDNKIDVLENNHTENEDNIFNDNVSSDSDYFIDKEVEIPQIRRRRPPRYRKTLKYISCLKCNIRYDTQREYNQHFRAYHSRKKSLCQDCGKLVAARYLELHRTTHLGEDRKILKCDICDKTFKMYHSLRQHKTLHTGEKKYECDVCHQKFNYWQSKKDHMLSRHSSSEKKTFECKACNKVFRHSSSLHAHNSSHHKSDYHKCKLCEKIFTSTSSLSQHLKRHKDPSLSCDECSKKFREKKALEIHKKHHAGERNYECEVCLKRYVDSVALRRHLKSVHTGHPLPPPRSKEFAEKTNVAKNQKFTILNENNPEVTQ